MLIDSHAHLDDIKYQGIQEDIIKDCKKDNVGIIINPAVSLESSYSSIELANKYDIVYAAVGIHPHEASNITGENLSSIKDLANETKVVGIGEIGLDYYYEYAPRKEQIAVLERQLEIAKEVDLPVIIHSRDAHQDTYDILKKYKEGLRGVLHSYSGSWEMAKRYIDLGFYISISGPITFKNARKLPEVVENVPLNRLMIETDSPYLTPVPFRGKVNHPKYVKYIAEKICEVRKCDINELLSSIEDNVKGLFNKIN